MIFRGYIEIGDNKRPLDPYTKKSNSELRTYDEVKNLKGYAGVLSPDVTLVDLDDKEESEKLLELCKAENIGTVVYKTTQGMHFYFKSDFRMTETNTSHRMTPLGLRVDYKHGCKNGIGNLKLTTEDEEREILYEGDKLEPVPVWLMDLGNTQNSIAEIDEGERNDRLFSYILTLQKHEMGKPQIRETIELVNKYILNNPITEDELEVILRDESFTSQLFFGGKNGSTFLFDKFAGFLVNEHSIIKINNQLHVYDDGVYKDSQTDIEALMIEHIPTLKQAQRTEVLHYINLLVRENTEPADAKYIAFKNGIYDIETDDFMGFSEDIVITNKINFNYNPSAHHDLVDKTFDKMAVHDKEIRALMEEALGYTFYRRNEMGKAFILTGTKSNGKSTFLTMLHKLLGFDNTASLDLNELGDRFKTAELFGKLANIGDDIGDEFIADTSVFKKLATGEMITAERKGEDPFKFKNYAKLLFSANDIPRMKDRTGAVLRRLVIVPFNARFSPNDADYDPHIITKLTTDEAMEYLIVLGIAGLKRVLSNNGFTQSTKVTKELDDFEVMNNPILLFFNEREREDILDIPTKTLYGEYVNFAHEYGMKPIGRNIFTKSVNDHYGTESVQKRVTVKDARGKESTKRCQVFG